jgi:hypothetical protein
MKSEQFIFEMPYSCDMMDHCKYIVSNLFQFSSMSLEIRELLALLLYVDRVNGTCPENRNIIVDISYYSTFTVDVKQKMIDFLRNVTIPAVLIPKFSYYFCWVEK